MQREQRLQRELLKLMKSPPQGVSVSSNYTSANVLEAALMGPDDSPYRDGIFNLEIHIPDNYPFCPPSIKFVTKVYHPNIDDNGRICLDLIQMPPKGRWRPTIGIEGLLIAVRTLLSSPNPQDPLMIEIAEEFMNNNGEFVEKAKSYCQKYAVIRTDSAL